MAEVIDLSRRLPGRDNLITAAPLEFRRGDWRGGHALMCSRAESVRFEKHRQEAFSRPGHEHIGFVPNHFTLDDGCHFTTLGLYRYRTEEALMRRVYRLAGLMECVTNAPSAILRTDLLRRFYQNILAERDSLKVIWRGNVQHFLLPLHTDLHNPNLFFHHIANCESLKELFAAIEEETNLQFDLIANNYVIYIPENFFA